MWGGVRGGVMWTFTCSTKTKTTKDALVQYEDFIMLPSLAIDDMLPEEPILMRGIGSNREGTENEML